MIRIGTRVSPAWLDRPDDLRFLQQLGVGYLDITLDMAEGYKESGGRVEKAALERVADRLSDFDFKIERANFLGSELLPVYLGQPEAERVIDNAVHTAGVLGELGIPVMGVQAYSAGAYLSSGRTEAYEFREGRGGYKYQHIDMRESVKDLPRPKCAPSAEELWDRLLTLYLSVVPAAEEAGVKVAMHGNDPPVPRVFGAPQILHNRAAFDRLFTEVPNPNNGITFCVGTRYESGENVFEMIRHFGEQKRLFHVHFRNVIGTLPANGEYSEVAPDEGDLDMAEVAEALHEVDYDGVIDYDHVRELINDSEGKSYIAYCLGYMRGILTSVQGNVGA